MALNFKYPAVDPFAYQPYGVRCTSLSSAGVQLAGSAAAAGINVPPVTAAVSVSNGQTWPGLLTDLRQGAFCATDGSHTVVLTVGVSAQSSYSSDAGATWATVTTPIAGFFFLIAANGLFWTAGNVNSTALYTSADGSAWSAAAVQPQSAATVRNWTAMATDGAQMAIAGVDNSFNQICYLTANGGASWTATGAAPPTFPQATAIWVSGSKIVTGDNSGGLYYSTDSGATWQTSTVSGFVPDGPKAIVKAGAALVMALNTAAHTGMIAVSPDGGASWTLNPSQPFQAAGADALTVDGNRLWAGGVDATQTRTIAYADLTAPPLRQFPRDDTLALGAVRQTAVNSGPTSRQASYRQGTTGTYS